MNANIKENNLLPRPKKKENKAQNNIVKKEAQSPKQLGCKNKIKAQGVANEQMIETGQKPNYGQLGGQGTKKYSKTTETLKNDWIQARDIIQIQGSRKTIHSSNAKMSNHMIHISSPEIADSTDRQANFDGGGSKKKLCTK